MKLPPEPSTSTSYAIWRKEINIWKQLTDTPKANQGLALQFACRTNKKIYGAILEIDEEKVKGDTGIDEVLKVLDQLHNLDEKETAVECYQAFESLKRKQNHTVSEFIHEFETALKKTQKKGNVLSDDLLAFKLMKAANLTQTDETILKASTEEFTYEEVKKTLKRCFGSCSYSTTEIKTEAVFQSAVQDCECTKKEGHLQQNTDSEDEESTFYAQRFNRSKNLQKYKPNKQIQIQNQEMKIKMLGGVRGKNPLDKYGNITQCNVCLSINHWAENCPDRISEEKEKVHKAFYTVTLFQDDTENPERTMSLVAETLGCGVLDCGTPKTVCGQAWIDSYLEILSKEDQEKVLFKDTTCSFKFGDGELKKAHTAVRLPIVLGSTKAAIDVEVVYEDIPLLLSRASMKRAKTCLNTADDTVTMLGENIPMIITSTGHYAVPICSNKLILEDKNAVITLYTRKSNMSPKEAALKLHRQFAHPPVDRLLKLLEKSGYGTDHELMDEVTEVSRHCQVCKKYKRTTPRPVVGMPIATRFNQTVAMEIKFYRGKPILHMIDALTRYTSSAFVKSKQAEVIVDTIFKHWISLFGTPGKFLSDNGGEFGN